MVGSRADGRCGVRRGDRRQRLDPRPEPGAVARCPRRAPCHSICEPADVRSRGQAESGARARRSLAAARRSHRLPASRARSAGRADRLAAAGVLEDRSPARLYEPAQSAGAVFRSIGRGRLRARRAAAGNGGARSSARRRLLHARSDGGVAALHPPAQLPDLPRGGEHARRARDDRAQPHRGTRTATSCRRRRPTPSIIRRATRIAGAAGSSPRKTRRRRISSWRTCGNITFSGKGEHLEPGVRRLDERARRSRAATSCPRPTSSACWSSIIRCTRSTC